MRQAVLGGSAVTGDYTYDKDSGPANIRFNASGALQYESTYQWAADGNLRSQSSTNGTHGGGTVIASYFHDSLDRIMNAFYDGAASKSEGWRYDLNGNITSFTQNGSTATYTYGDGARVNRLSGVSGRFTRSYGYDASGRITGDGLRTFAYEHMGRVMSLWKSGYGTESYLYDGAGLRVKEVTPTGTTFNIRGLSGEVLAEYNASGGLVAEYYYAGAQRVALRKGSTTQYYLTDHLGSARRLYPVVSNWSADYYAFGEIEEQRGTEGEPTFDYTGQERDFGTGVMYYGARYYDPQVGRFLQVDPRVDKYRGWSPYNYALNNPLLYVDPQGDTVRVYVETQGVGHSWLSIGEGDNMVVYTYGRYAGTKDGSSGGTPLSNGPGVMVRLEGKDAAAYNASKLDAEGFAGFKILDVTDQDVGKIMEQRFASSTEMPTTGEYANDPRAHVIDDYNILSNNCTTNVSDALNSAGSRALERGFVVRRTTAILRQTQRFVNPASLGSHLKAKTIYPGY